MLHNSSTVRVLAAVALLLLVCLGIFLYLEKRPRLGGKYSSTNTVSDVLQASNENYATALSYEDKGNYTAALQSYQEALSTAQDQNQASVIDRRIAGMSADLGNYSQAITDLKQIAANTAFPSLSRAYAVEALGRMYYNSTGTASTTNAIISQTFSGQPYVSFAQGVNTAEAYRRLFEYAVTFYTMPYSEAHIASWYASDAASMQGATSTGARASSIAAAQAALQKIPAAMVPTGENQNPSDETGIYTVEGVATGVLATMGAADPQQAETDFQQAENFNAQAGGKQGSFVAYDYAAFLANEYGTSRLSDIEKLLSVFSASNSANIDPAVAAFFSRAITPAGQASAKMNLILLAQLDPDFKTYLTNLGWTAADFK